MDEVYMIPHKDLEQLIQYYKGELTENALLNKAATLARQKTCLVKTTSKIVKKGSPSTSRRDIRSRLKAIRERRKTLEKKLAESPWGKGKGKASAREVERLKPLPGWEDWARGKKLRRRLDYDSD